MTVEEMQKESWQNSEDHGFHVEEINVPKRLMLMVEELTEAFQEIRDGHDLTKITYRESDGKPEGFPTEIADLVIRASDLATQIGFSLNDVIELKQKFNRTRPYMHGRTC